MGEENGSPAAAMSLKSGGEERPSRRKEGWEEGTEGAGVGAGPPGRGRGRATLWAFSLLLFFFKSIQMFFLLKLDGFTFTAGVDAGKIHKIFFYSFSKKNPTT